jgi:hypothetical protein
MNRRSPIRESPLRAPGQSTHERKIDLVLDRIAVPAVLATFLVANWVQDLWRSYLNAPPVPWFSGTIAAIGVGYATWKVKKAMSEITRLRLGRQGEQAVGQGLEQLRSEGYAVYHDLVADGFNVDHVLVGPAGVFTIETKTWSKPVRGQAELLVDGDTITINGHRPARDPVPQARAQSSWISDVLRRSTGRPFPVSPVILIPGWWIETRSKPSNLWIVNDKALPKFLAREKRRLEDDEVAMAKFHLETFIRSREAAALSE